MAVGIAIGIAIGVMMDNLAIGIGIGLIFGIAIDAISQRERQKKEKQDEKSARTHNLRLLALGLAALVLWLSAALLLIGYTGHAARAAPMPEAASSKMVPIQAGNAAHYG